MAFEDEIPQAEQIHGNPEDEIPFGQAEFDSSIAGDIFGDVPKMNDPIPAGTYHARVKQYTRKVTDEGQPYFSIGWTMQQEPVVGRMLFENVPWVRQEDIKDALSAASPRRSEALKAIRDRLPRAKEIMEACGFNPPKGDFKYEDFLNSNPECKLVVIVKPMKASTGLKDAQGKKIYKETGDMGNEVRKHLSLFAPGR